MKMHGNVMQTVHDDLAVTIEDETAWLAQAEKPPKRKYELVQQIRALQQQIGE